VKNELKQGLLSGSIQKWWVADQYKIVNGAVAPIGRPNSRWQSYSPFDFPQLPLHLAKLKDGNKDLILEFVHTWGLLGYTQLMDCSSPESREALWGKVNRGSDPINWITHHAKIIEIVLHLLDRRSKFQRNGQPKILWDAIQYIMQDHTALITPDIIKYALGHLNSPLPDSITRKNNGVKEKVAKLFKGILESNIVYLQDSLLIEDNGNIIRSKSFSALLPVIYSHLADAVTGQRSYTRCSFEECGNYFIQSDPRQRYCPHPGNSKSESLCSLKARKRKFLTKDL
jgi:hypothetical protein